MSSVTSPSDRARDAIDGRPPHDASAGKPDAALGWIAIAIRPRGCMDGQKLYWDQIPGAPVSVQEARRLAAAGTLLMASRYQPDRVELVVRLSTATLTRAAPIGARPACRSGDFRQRDRLEHKACRSHSRPAIGSRNIRRRPHSRRRQPGLAPAVRAPFPDGPAAACPAPNQPMDRSCRLPSALVMRRI